MAHYDIYRDQLTNLYRGFALWEPDSGGQYDRVSVGDVGFIREGRFNRLFNILLSGNDESHELGVPDSFETIIIPSRNTIGTLRSGKYCSSSVREARMAIGAQIAACVIICSDKERAACLSKLLSVVRYLPRDHFKPLSIAQQAGAQHFICLSMLIAKTRVTRVCSAIMLPSIAKAGLISLLQKVSASIGMRKYCL
jgi:hypothetical protein